jgi:rfaE bifunctional protein kinase chain/domain
MDELEGFSKVKVLVVGDVMLDKYLWGDVFRISPEAPVPVVRLKNTELIAGGAANVAANIAGLGATAYLLGVIGDDTEGSVFPEVLSKANVSANHLVKIKNRQTTIKTRILAHNQQIARIDQETTERLTPDEEKQVWHRAEAILEEIDVILISDYNKGILTESLVSRLIREGKAHRKTILIDPKGKDYSKYRGATIITPNKFEVSEICAVDMTEESLRTAGKKLLKELEIEALLITQGEEGMTLFERDKPAVHLGAMARDVYDVTGAGDTVIATLAVAMGAGRSFQQAAKIANTAAGLVVRELGTTTIKFELLKENFSSLCEIKFEKPKPIY